MKAKRLISLILVLVLASALFSGCGQPKTENPPESPAESAEVPAAEAAEAEERSVTDMLGREVKLPAEVKTIAVLGASAGRMVTYAGCADMLVGITDGEKKCQPGMPYAYVNKERFETLASTGPGGPSSEVYDEAVALLNPDVIFTNWYDANEANTVHEKLNIPVVALKFDGVFDDNVYGALRLVGEVAGRSEYAEKVVEQLEVWHSDLMDRTKDIPEEDKPSVYVGAVTFRGGHGIDGTHAQYPPFVAINAKNVVDETGEESSFMVEKEKIADWDPDIIFLTPSNMNIVNEDYAANPAFYDNLSAVKNGQVYSQVSYKYYGTNIEVAVVDAYYAGKVIYPEQFADVDLDEKADEIFEFMLGEPYMQVLKDNGDIFGPVKIGA